MTALLVPSPATTQPWFEVVGLDEQSVKALVSGEIAAVRIPQVASLTECSQFLAGADNHGYEYYQNVTPRIGKIGITQFECRMGPRQTYFSGSQDARRSLDEISSGSFSPVERVIEAFASVASVGYASEAGYGAYFAGLIRQINTALLHIDWGPLDGPQWRIGSVITQLAWNIYLKVPDDGGQCVVHKRMWRPTDEAFKIEGSYGYDPVIVAGTPESRLVPRVGDLVIFNSRFFHEVLSGTGSRITVSSFIGRLPNGEWILWS